MKVNRERLSQRLNPRITAALYVWIDGEKYETKDWSLGGLGLKNFDAEGCFNENLEGQVELPFQGFDIRFVAVISLLRTIAPFSAFKRCKVALCPRRYELHHRIYRIYRIYRR